MAVSICFTKDVVRDGAEIVLAFPGAGLVGSIAGTFISRSADFEFVGYVVSEDFAPLAAIHDYRPLPPVRLYFSQSANILLVLSEIVIPLSATLPFAEEIVALAKRINARRILVLGGMAKKQARGKDVYAVSSDTALLKSIIREKLAKGIREGATTGVPGVVLSLSTVNRLSTLALLVEAEPDVADADAALLLLERFSKLTGLTIDVRELEREARKRRTVARTTTFQDSPLGPMYG